MARQPRSRAAVVGTSVALALAACATDGPTSPSTTSSTSSVGPSSSSSSTSSDTSSRTPSPASTSSSSSTSPAPDPDVPVTPAADGVQSAAQRSAGTAAADGQEGAERLSIPAVGLSTAIGPQGLRGGKVNPGPGEVIWFTGHDRVSPGATGTSVIAGHVVNRTGPDEFAALEQLETGDGVVVSYAGGERLRFEVTRTEVVDKDALTTDPAVWGDNADTRRIVLVTCDDELGFREDGHREANFVAVAELPS